MRDAEKQSRAVEILLVEDDPNDIAVMREAFAGIDSPNRLTVLDHGADALPYLRREDKFKNARKPDLILLDLKLPGRHGREILAEIKSDRDLRRIPVVVLTSSQMARDVEQAYDLNANSFISKPADRSQLAEVVKHIEDFWLKLVKLPTE